ncbi:hypothetical protein DMB95_01475 [Campylobacter sp. MIT 12-8780]|uniref:ATP-grasp fold amidoligase family protein n=1 Tax=unclassified Campylobacter TaxID=2593542 RepID=UPI00115CBD20|nr:MULTISPECIES: ATP-grasp fold amidoligase family protein [unclassified Campylobacter]NDJ26630.1 hypothetical protein [Campylobacter sp. MIT 19-121]TQR43190.1 hypothetical protein DMB95_01475 [Campylobacter sp. MIT 12-8780]
MRNASIKYIDNLEHNFFVKKITSNSAALVFFANNDEILELAVTIQSIIENSGNKEKMLDVIVFSNCFPLRYWQMFLNMQNGKSNVLLRAFISYDTNLKEKFLSYLKTEYKNFMYLDHSFILEEDIFSIYEKHIANTANFTIQTKLSNLDYNINDNNLDSLWWQYAKQTPFYELCLFKFMFNLYIADKNLDISKFLLSSHDNFSYLAHFDNFHFDFEDLAQDQRREVHIVYMCDKKQSSIKKCAVSMLSVLENKDEKDFIHFYFIIDEGFKETDTACLDFLNTKHSTLTFLKVDSSDFELYRSTTQRKNMPINAYYRLAIPWLLPHLDRVIYLDYDSVVLDSLWELYNLDISQYYLGVVDDAWKYFRYKEMMHIQPESRHYNSGMLLFNAKKWRDEKIDERLKEFSLLHKDVFVLADQFLINAVLNKNIRFIHFKYNLQLSRIEIGERVEFDDLNELKIAKENPVIIHFNLGKAWQLNACLNPFFFKWWECARKLPFYTDILVNAVKDSVLEHYSFKYKVHEGAVQRIKDQLSYRLGSTLIKTAKNPIKCIILPYSLIKTINEYQRYKKQNSIPLPPLETYADYEEALKVKNHLSYKIGSLILNTHKKGIIGYISLPFALIQSSKEHKNASLSKHSFVENNIRTQKEFSLKDDELFLTQRHKQIFGYIPNFKLPQTFNEKIISRMLYDRSPVYIALADKIKARIYIAATLEQEQKTFLASDVHIFSSNSPLFEPIDSLETLLFRTNECKYLPKLYGIYKNAYDIDFEQLPNSFVLKTNHDSGGVVIVENKKEFLRDVEKLTQSLKKLQWHLNRNYYDFAREWQYKDIEPRILAEELLLNNDKPADTYKIHIFDQDDMKNNFFQVTTDRFDNYQRAMLDSAWNLAPFGITYDNSKITKIPNKPQALETMLNLSLKLAKPFDYVRVDLYQNANKIYIGELTFTPGAAGERIIPNEWDKKLGDLWKFKRLIDESK